MKIGNIEVKKLYLGALELEKVYAGIHLAYTKSHPVPVEYDGLTFTAQEAGSTILYAPSTVSTAEYSTNGTNWISADNVTITLSNVGDKVYFRGVISGNQTASNCAKFIMTGLVAASGSIMSMYNNNPDDLILSYNYTFYGMFKDCTSLVTAPELPATTLTSNCYNHMFYGCTSLTTAPELTTTTLTSYCYAYMFQNCTSLINLPELPATTVLDRSYYYMFNGCTSLVDISNFELPGTTLNINSYGYMFANCSSIEKAPELPVANLASNCYAYMFQNCVSLTETPIIYNEPNASSCYSSMFSGCSNLSKITVDVATWDISNTGGWVKNVAATGAFYNLGGAYIPFGTSGIPTGWIIAKENLTFTAQQANSTIKYNKCSVTTAEYSTDGTNWNNANGVTITLANVGDKVYFRGKVSGNQSDSVYANFTMTGLVGASGSLMSMYNNNPNDTTMTYEKSLQTLFRDCTSLVTTPELPATTLSINCYNNLFYGCTSLVTAPELPATDLKDGCYYHMFYGCTSLVTAPELPATTLKTYCYTGMFYGCTSLVTAPELPATALITSSYGNQWTSTDGMFYGCSSLNYIKCLATSMQSNSTTNWVYGVASTGTFVTPSTTNWTTGVSGIPTGWTRVNSDPQTEYDGLTFTAKQANSTVKYTKSSYTTAEYSTDGTNWNNANDVTITLANVGDKVYFRGEISGTQSSSNYANFTMTGIIAASGSIMSMYNKDAEETTISTPWSFYRLFYNCTSLTTAPDLTATTLSGGNMYNEMFYACTSLEKSGKIYTAPSKTATFKITFSGCNSLSYIEYYGSSWNTSNASSWVNGVASQGDFYNLGGASITSGTSGIPSGWTTHTTK